MMSLYNLIAFAPPPQGTEANPTGQILQTVLMFGVLGVMFYFLLIRPQAKQRKEHESMLNNVKSGDRVITSGGIYGIVTNVKEKSVMVKIADNVKVEVAKSAITGIVPKSDESTGESKQG